MVFLDLFSGTGGFAYGLKEAGFAFTKHYFSEIDKYAIANYRYNFKESMYVGAIENISSKIEKPDIITFGFPCQDISLAGKRQGLYGARSGLFFKALSLIKEFKPRVFIFENVKGLFSSGEGKDFEIVLKAIAQLGLYECEWQLLNTSWFLPQNRERIFFIGHLGEKSGGKVFPIIPKDTKDQKGNCEKQKKILICDDFKYEGNVKRQQNRIFYPQSISNTLTTAGELKVHDQGRIRRLSPIEYERLQGFPDEWTKYGTSEEGVIQISDTQRYHLLGNAVSVPVVKAIGEKLLFDVKPGNMLIGMEKKGKASEIQVSFKNTDKRNPVKFSQSEEVANFARSLFDENTIELNEQVFVLFLDKSNKLKGYYHHSKGGLDSAIVDKRIILATALKCLSLGMILIHNHPSGSNHPSETDKVLTSTFSKAAKLMGIKLIDHLIITKDAYFSFADDGSLEGIKKVGFKEPSDELVRAMAIHVQLILMKGRNK